MQPWTVEEKLLLPTSVFPNCVLNMYPHLHRYVYFPPLIKEASFAAHGDHFRNLQLVTVKRTTGPVVVNSSGTFTTQSLHLRLEEHCRGRGKWNFVEEEAEGL